MKVSSGEDCIAADTGRKSGRQEQRTRETRELLLRAAKIIFIRDGYEGTDLKDVAELADRTKGAIYGHFKGKEDIFLALVATHRRQYRDRLSALLGKDVQQNVAVMRQFVIELADDKDWALLLLEFKLFTLRHPGARAKFQRLYTEERPAGEQRFARLLGPANEEGSITRSIALASMIPILSGLLLETEFEPDILQHGSIKEVIAKVYDCLLADKVTS